MTATIIQLDVERAKRGKLRLMTQAEKAMYEHETGRKAFGRKLPLDTIADRNVSVLHDCGNASGMPELA